MPVTSGMEYKVTEYEQGKFRLEELTINGHERGKGCAEKETQTAQGAGRAQGQAAGIRQPSGHAAGQELLFQNRQ